MYGLGFCYRSRTFEKTGFRHKRKFRKTSRDRPKSAPYPRLKNSRKTSKCQVFSFTVFENRIFFQKIFKKRTEWRAKVSQCRKTERGDPLRFFNIHSVAKHEKIEENKNFYFRGKNLTMPKKTERGTLSNFSTSILSQNIKKMQGDPLRKKNFSKKSLAVPKKNERGGLWSRMV